MITKKEKKIVIELNDVHKYFFIENLNFQFVSLVFLNICNILLIHLFTLFKLNYTYE